MTAHVIRGDARALPLPDESVDLIVTSPPYFALRSYTDGGEHYGGQIGSEATPAEYVAALVECTREWVRVLKPSGSLWVNLGDKYDSGTTAGRVNPGTVKDGQGQGWHQGTPRATVGRPKSLLGLPWRYALACIDQLDLILRAEVIWSKPNGLPESVTDRVRRSHEQWFHMVRQPRYYSAVDEIREPHAPESWTKQPGWKAFEARSQQHQAVKGGGASGEYKGPNPLGKLPGSVWTVPTEPLKVPDHLGVDHFAAFPSEWPRRIVSGWSPPGICVECSEGRRPVVDKQLTGIWHDKPVGDSKFVGQEAAHRNDRKRASDAMMRTFGSTSATITGYVCACPEPTAPTRPSVVLDPFGGTGTVALVASALGRTGLTVDMSNDYCRLAQWRTTDPGQRAKVLGVAAPVKQVEGQLSLLNDDTEGAA